MLRLLQELAAHAGWADSIFMEAWGQSPARDNEEMRRRAAHVFGVQRGFLAILSGEEPGGPPPGPPPDFDELKSRAIKAHAMLGEHVAALGPADLTRLVRIPWLPDPPCIITVAEALVQVVMHAQHHRGQCMTRLKELGGEPQNVDWIIWLWKEKPASVWN